MEILGLVLVGAGVVIAVIAKIWLLITAFKESALWGLGCIFVPLVTLIFVITHWDDAKKPFFLSLVTAIPIIAGVLLMESAKHSSVY